MRKHSKSTEELYRAKFPTNKLTNNPYACAKAIGYLECLVEHCPNAQTWVIKEVERLTAMAFESIMNEV